MKENSVLQYFKSISKDILYLGVLVVVVLLLLKQCNKTEGLKEEYMIAQHNQVALIDSISTYKKRTGFLSSDNDKLIFQKSTLLTEKRDLKLLNNKLHGELKYLQGNPIIITKFKTVVEHDTIYMESQLVHNDDGSKSIEWSHDTTYTEGNFRMIAGTSTFTIDDEGNILSKISTTLNVDSLGIEFVTGIEEVDGNYNVFIRSDYPGFAPRTMEAAILDENIYKDTTPNWVVGPSIGYGIVGNSTGIHTGIFVGANVTWNLSKKIKKIFK